MAVIPYINFNGNCREAVNFYTDVFRAEKRSIMTYGDIPANPDFPMSEASKKRVMHTYLNIMDGEVMFSDVPEHMPVNMGDNITLTVTGRDEAEIRRIFDRLKEGGEVTQDLQQTFWSKCYGYVTDRFGIGWQVSLED